MPPKPTKNGNSKGPPGTDTGSEDEDNVEIDANRLVSVSSELTTEEENDDTVCYGPLSTVSPLWNFFEKVSGVAKDGEKEPARCTVKISGAGDTGMRKCGHLCKRTGGNTRTMESHLKSHPFAYAQFTQLKQDSLKSKSSSSTSSTVSR